ncbi:helix-hairpin-helix domain-containing protein [Phyllobacterium zundukense]|jgi:NADH-quinone oxidoreductase subunit E|uniref:NADH-ubiquinone dehydrogenase n=1 Tax=Phyllobacterium zundukense TaxID=1867719 RepID=A0ACD4D3J9_9HYPH|nr:helix-hairpin-helix domain-containing protein [Phyllobacterium zundukense]UXN60443.1 NADH-ubiquinone dehydrogenase [Phyllobacterium zundukense]
MSDSGTKNSSADLAALMPKHVLPAANLLTPQLGAVAAASALGLGVASQMWGFWAGAMASAFDMNTRLTSVSSHSRVVEPQPSPDLDALKAIIRKNAGAVEKKTPVLTGKMPAAKKMPATEINTSVAINSLDHTVATASEIATDDLKRISGIGPKLEQVLNAMGIRTYDQIAAWTADDLAKVDDQLKLGGRISRDDWLGQANVLVMSNGAGE